MKGLAPSHSRVFWFVVTGGLATLTHLAVFVAIVEFLQLTPVAASVPSFLIALSVSYCGNRSWTFKSSGSHISELSKYTIVAVSGLLANVGITYVIVDVLGAWYGIALVLVVTIVPVVTFFLSKKWVFISTTT